MRLRVTILPLAFAGMFAMGCSKSDHPAQAPAAPANPPGEAASAPAESFSGAPASDSEAKLIRQAVEDHVRNNQGIKSSAMEMTVDSANVRGDQAQANVTFRVKQGGASMAMVYALERHGNGWLVVKNQPAEGQFVHPPMDKTHTGMSPNPSAPAMPDVQNYFKNHPAPDSN